MVPYFQYKLLGIATRANFLINRVIEAIEGLEGDLGEIVLLLDAISAPLEGMHEKPSRVCEGSDKQDRQSEEKV